jgi:hypothetical protein
MAEFSIKYIAALLILFCLYVASALYAYKKTKSFIGLGICAIVAIILAGSLPPMLHSSLAVNQGKAVPAEQEVASESELRAAKDSCPGITVFIHRDAREKFFNGEKLLPITRLGLDGYLSECRKTVKEKADRDLFNSQLKILDGEAAMPPGK